LKIKKPLSEEVKEEQRNLENRENPSRRQCKKRSRGTLHVGENPSHVMFGQDIKKGAGEHCM
jgi:hypothetical protein